MGYIHKGIVLENGVSVTGTDPDYASGLNVNPEDDGLHIIDLRKGDFEWWYFDIIDQISDCFLKIVFHIGTDPLKTRISPRLAISVNSPGRSESFTKPYFIRELESNTSHCNISIRDEIKISSELDRHSVYFIKINIPQFECNFKFTGEIEGWKPLGMEVPQQIGNKRGSFSWIIPIPRAKVEGDFTFKDKNYIIHNGTGYHDHNYIKIDKHNPLHLDDLITKWYWGKCYADRFTVIFMDTYCRTNRIRSLMVAEKDKIIYSANNLIDCSILSCGYDSILNSNYPAKLRIKSEDVDFIFQTEFDFVRISDRKDLLDGLNPVLKYVVKKLVARPVYYGITAKVNLRLGDRDLEGYGNFEYMFFRKK